MEGRITQLFLAQEKNTPMKPVTEAEAVTQRGFLGDRHSKRAAGGRRQVLLMDVQSLEELGLAPGTMKENVVIAGLPLESYRPGQRLALGAEMVVELTEQCVPCQKMNAIRPGLLKESWGKRGQLARVLQGGHVKAGDVVRVLDVNPDAPQKILPKLPD